MVDTALGLPGELGMGALSVAIVVWSFSCTKTGSRFTFSFFQSAFFLALWLVFWQVGKHGLLSPESAASLSFLLAALVFWSVEVQCTETLSVSQEKKSLL